MSIYNYSRDMFKCLPLMFLMEFLIFSPKMFSQTTHKMFYRYLWQLDSYCVQCFACAVTESSLKPHETGITRPIFQMRKLLGKINLQKVSQLARGKYTPPSHHAPPFSTVESLTNVTNIY